MNVRQMSGAGCLLMMCGMLSLGAEAASSRTGAAASAVEGSVTLSPIVESLPPEPANVARSAWWTVFNEEPLNQLLAAAKQPQGYGAAASNTYTMAGALTGQYMVLRVLNLRLRNLQAFKDALSDERHHVAAQPPMRQLATTLVAIDRRAHASEALAKRYLQELASSRQEILRLAGDSVAAREALSAAEALEHLPWYPRAVPVRLPAAVLGSRSDIAYLFRFAPSRSQLPSLLAGWIEATGTPAPLQLDSTEGASLPVSDVVRQAAHEVSWYLGLLIQEVGHWNSQVHLMDAARLEFTAVQRRAQAGAADQAAVSQGLQKVLLQADAVAVVHARLALAWVELLSRAPSASESLRDLRAQVVE